MSLRVVPIFGEIEESSGDAVLRMLWDAMDDEDVTHVLVPIDSVGGSIQVAFAMLDALDALRAHGIPSIGYGTGAVYSCAVTIMQGFDLRVASPRCRFLVHGVAGVMDGMLHHLRQDILEIEQLAREQATELARRSTVPEDDWVKMMSTLDQHYLSADEAMELGLIDAVIERSPFLEVSDELLRWPKRTTPRKGRRRGPHDTSKSNLGGQAPKASRGRRDPEPVPELERYLRRDVHRVSGVALAGDGS